MKQFDKFEYVNVEPYDNIIVDGKNMIDVIINNILQEKEAMKETNYNKMIKLMLGDDDTIKLK